MKKILTAIRERVERRREMYQTFVVNQFPDLRPLKSPIIIGQFSRTETQGKYGTRRRFIQRAGSIQIAGMIETPTSIARDFLNVQELKAKRIKQNFDLIRSTAQRLPFAPGMAIPCQFDDGFYIDIHACYLSLMQITGWNVLYNPCRYLAAGNDLDFPFPENKIARNSLVSIARPHDTVKMLPPGGTAQIVRERSYNPYLNFQLSAIISDALHALANLAKLAGAIYVNTDGYIAPNDRVRREIQQLIADFGLLSRIKHRGAGIVSNMASYSIGDFKTKNNEYRIIAPVQSNIAEIDHARWLQKNLQFWAAKRNPGH